MFLYQPSIIYIGIVWFINWKLLIKTKQDLWKQFGDSELKNRVLIWWARWRLRNIKCPGFWRIFWFTVYTNYKWRIAKNVNFFAGSIAVSMPLLTCLSSDHPKRFFLTGPSAGCLLDFRKLLYVVVMQSN